MLRTLANCWLVLGSGDTASKLCRVRASVESLEGSLLGPGVRVVVALRVSRVLWRVMYQTEAAYSKSFVLVSGNVCKSVDLRSK